MAVAPLLDFHSWYKYSKGLKVLFSAFFTIFGFFSVDPPPPLGKFSADGLNKVSLYFDCFLAQCHNITLSIHCKI